MKLLVVRIFGGRYQFQRQMGLSEGLGPGRRVVLTYLAE